MAMDIKTLISVIIFSNLSVHGVLYLIPKLQDVVYNFFVECFDFIWRL